MLSVSSAVERASALSGFIDHGHHVRSRNIGLDCDTGEPLGAAIRADYTVTFVAVKRGFTSPRAAGYTGRVFVASIGVVPGQKAPA